MRKCRSGRMPAGRSTSTSFCSKVMRWEAPALATKLGTALSGQTWSMPRLAAAPVASQPSVSWSLMPPPLWLCASCQRLKACQKRRLGQRDRLGLEPLQPPLQILGHAARHAEIAVCLAQGEAGKRGRLVVGGDTIGGFDGVGDALGQTGRQPEAAMDGL